jgi:hypothetical protein
MWVPQTLLLGSGVRWRAESDTAIIATVDVPPERPDVRFEIDPGSGALRSISLLRWGNVGQDHFGYIPFGAEERFGALVLPSRVTAGWWFGTPRYEPSFEATILSAEPISWWGITLQVLMLAGLVALVKVDWTRVLSRRAAGTAPRG